MRLLLEVVSAQAGAMGAGRRRVVGADGVMIGREGSSAQHWVLPDPTRYVSKHHATVRFLNGLFFVEGKGTNPIAINERTRTLRNDDPHPLNEGDRIFIDEYEIRASIVGDDAVLSSAAPDSPPLADLVSGTTRGMLDPPLVLPTPGAARPVHGVDPLDLLGGPRPQPAQPQRAQARPQETAAEELLGRAFRPAAIDLAAPPDSTSDRRPRLDADWFASAGDAGATGGPTATSADTAPDAALSDDWFNSRPVASTPPAAAKPSAAHSPSNAAAPVTPRRAPLSPRSAAPTTPQSVAAPSAAPHDGLRALLRGAGLDPGVHALPPEVERQLGEVLRIVVQGTMDALRARAEIKNQFRMPVTQIARRDNNPLKFSVDAADALHDLLLKQNNAYLPIAEAFDDAFEDIRFHQVAMLKGMQAGFERVLAHFDPEGLQQRFEKNAPSGGLKALASSKGRRWEQYVEAYRELAADREDTFRRLFGDEFAKAYEDQLRRLKAVKRAEKRDAEGPR